MTFNSYVFSLVSLLNFVSSSYCMKEDYNFIFKKWRNDEKGEDIKLEYEAYDEALSNPPSIIKKNGAEHFTKLYISDKKRKDYTFLLIPSKITSKIFVNKGNDVHYFASLNSPQEWYCITEINQLGDNNEEKNTIKKLATIIQAFEQKNNIPDLLNSKRINGNFLDVIFK